MKFKLKPLIVISVAFLTSILTVKAEVSHSGKESFTVGKGNFLLNGEPFIIKAAELHYPRIPKEYWDHRIKMSKALGMNTICLYVFWNIHEQKEGEFDFTGQNDLRKFIELCAENDMKVILRPGPYVCAEWEMGGLPWWLLKNKDIKLREDDPLFMQRVEEFQKAVSNEVGDLTIQNGGPIIMVQVENEYGAYGENKAYVGKIRDILRKYFGDEVVMFQCDWNSNFTLNGLDDLVWTMNFGTGADIDSQFAELKSLRPDSPLMCSEFWSGWFDKWGAAHETRPATDMIAGIDEMLSKDISFSLYMTHGGTNWGHWAGANSPGYSPDVTSYDYDAPINESGQPTEKYWLLRETLAKYLADGDTLPPVPPLIEPISIEKFELTEIAPLASNLPSPLKDRKVKTFEDYDMGFGSILYSTTLPRIKAGSKLTVNEPHDYAQIFINDELIGVLDRRNGEKELVVDRDFPKGGRLDILVEATGRINFGRAIKDFKGITENVCLDGKELKDWNVYLLPDSKDFYESLKYEKISGDIKARNSRMPAGAYRGSFTVEKPSDTFLNMETWGKGLVYVNGHPIGRFWGIGPQQTLYVPGPWLREGENDILVFDIVGPDMVEVEGLSYPVYDKVKVTAALDADSSGPEIDFSLSRKVLEASFPAGNGWKEVQFETPVKAKELTIVILDTHDDSPAAIAELYLLDENGKRLDRERWQISASSENKGGGNHTADKIIDLQESTYWRPAPGVKAMNSVTVSLEKEETISAIQYLPRMENGAPGGIRNFRVYVK